VPQGGQQPLDARAVPLLDDIVERLEPFTLFDGLDFGGVTRCDVPIFDESFGAEPDRIRAF
jgi:hypothetical protein